MYELKSAGRYFWSRLLTPVLAAMAFGVAAMVLYGA